MNSSGTQLNDPMESWKILKKAINDIQDKKASNWSFEQLYRLTYNLVLSKHSLFLYNNIKDELIGHLNGNVLIQFKNLLKLKEENGISTEDISEILRYIKQIWNDHELSVKLVSEISMYMDRTFTKDNKLPLIYDIGLISFRNCIFNQKVDDGDNDETIGDKVIRYLITYYNLNRNGEIVDKSLIIEILKIFKSLIDLDDVSFYNGVFLPKFLRYSHDYYLGKVNEVFQNKTHLGSIFIYKINEIINNENSQFEEFLFDSQTIEMLQTYMYNDLINLNIDTILDLKEDGLQCWIDLNNFEILTILYSLIGLVKNGKSNYLKPHLKKIVLQNGVELTEISKPELPIEDAKKLKKGSNSTQFAINYVKNFIALKSKYDQIINISFNGDLEIFQEVESTFTTFLNEDNKVQEYLSLFIDENFKKLLKNKTSAEINDFFSNVILIFKFIKDKDIFEKYYKNHLAKRLLNQKSISTELELMLITEFKLEIGSSFTSKFEGMFKDMNISKDITKSFNDKSLLTTLSADLAKFNNGKSFDREFLILTDNFWPMSVNKSLNETNYPAVLAITQSSFEKFYHDKYNGRNLKWAPNMCTIDLKMNFPNDKTYEINMPTLTGLIILTCFNDEYTENGDNYYTFGEIQNMMQIPAVELKRHLQSITNSAKAKLLKKVPSSKTIEIDDKFTLNLDFKSSSYKVKVIPVSMKESNSSRDPTMTLSKIENDNERSDTLRSVQKSRELEIDAAIIRIMKANKSLKFENLVNEVIRIIEVVSKRFKPQVTVIKKRIEELVDKEYLRRDENERDLFWYIA